MSTQYIFLMLMAIFRNSHSQQFINCKSTSQCRRSYLVCVDNEDCDIDCSFPDRACQSSIIMCPSNGKCNIHCSNSQACNNAQIRAEDANLLNLQCDDHPESCLNLQIYCPHNEPSESKTCQISGVNDFMGVNIFAINGFSDIQFNIQSSLPSTTIHCDNTDTPSIDFDYSCVISSTPPFTQCINDPNTCNTPTIQPSNSPSMEPTVIPTSSPTAKLITLTPTNSPTMSPSDEPTGSPMDTPTDVPSMSPSSAPTSDSDSMTSTDSEYTNSENYNYLSSTPTNRNDRENDTNVVIIKTINNSDKDNIDHTKSITINLTNLMYIIVGTVLICCFICAICLLFNILSTRLKFKNGKLHKWSLSNHIRARENTDTDTTDTNTKTNTDTNDPYNLNNIASTFKLRRNSNSSSELHSDTPILPTTTNAEEEDREYQHYTQNEVIIDYDNGTHKMSMVAQPRTSPALPYVTNTNSMGAIAGKDGYIDNREYKYEYRTNPVLPGIREEPTEICVHDNDDAISQSFTMPDVNPIQDREEEEEEDGVTITVELDGTETQQRNRNYWIDNRAPKGMEQIVPMFSDKASEFDDTHSNDEQFSMRLANSVNVNKLLSDQIINDMKTDKHYD
eukprot:CAMPEP_0201566016 /NCGR_PEP_ID=MMETSP0190_2-20130828/5508_1 /ASSEMBLY_ACC=CAM_ASM_000263 /TAXON_ID=37353 /ORGANISM="Rosalina sp." /LENGTH=618 /DNA_ID=CAMNT_0047984173 /DNA_START=30 /DNA_END=1886 /DNA_ORIENTATION=+